MQRVEIDLGDGYSIIGQAEQMNNDYTWFEVNNSPPQTPIPSDVEVVSKRIVYGTEFNMLKVPAHRVKIVTDADAKEITDEMFGFLDPSERPYGLI